MVEKFKMWMTEVQDQAIADKRRKAREKGDESKWRKQIWKSPDKNIQIKERFVREGLLLNYKPRPSSVSGAGEWLYDFVWRDFDDNGNLLNVVLTMEIEVSAMNYKDIRYDFQKLLQADSKYKILVFQLKTPDEIAKSLKNFKKDAQFYNSKIDSHFLLCGWCTSKNQFIFDDFCIAAARL